MEPGEEYLGWVLGALCTSVGTFLSTHKANLERPVGLIFKFTKQSTNLLLRRFRLSGLPIRLSTRGAVRQARSKRKNPPSTSRSPQPIRHSL